MILAELEVVFDGSHSDQVCSGSIEVEEVLMTGLVVETVELTLVEELAAHSDQVCSGSVEVVEVLVTGFEEVVLVILETEEEDCHCSQPSAETRVATAATAAIENFILMVMKAVD